MVGVGWGWVGGVGGTTQRRSPTHWPSTMHMPPLQGTTPPMRADTRRLLAEFYRPHNEALAALLDDADFAWPAEGSASS